MMARHLNYTSTSDPTASPCTCLFLQSHFHLANSCTWLWSNYQFKKVASSVWKLSSINPKTCEDEELTELA
jgi:hypothetical protein